MVGVGMDEGGRDCDLHRNGTGGKMSAVHMI